MSSTKMFAKFKKYLKGKLRILKLILIHIRSYFIKKEDNIWVFGAIQGNKYLDNAKYLFEYINKNTDIIAIWLSKNPQVIEELKSKGMPAFYMYSKEGIDYAIRAKVAVITHRGNNNNADLPFYAFSNKTKIIQLWHGIPLKKIGYDDKIFSFSDNEKSFSYKYREFKKNLLYPYNRHLHKPDMVIALSYETQKIFSSAFRIPKNKIVVTGYPRNDIIINNNKNMHQPGTKKIIYMPTFRGKIGTSFDLFLDYDFDVDKMNLFLKRNTAQLFIKLHPFNKPSDTLLHEIESSNNILFFQDDDAYSSLASFDLLITDYSSIYFDYLLLDKPIIFALFDKESYLNQDRELYFEYDEVTPGPKAMNWDEVMESLKIFNKDPQAYSKERKIIKDRFHTYQDDKSTERVYEAILDIVNKK